MKQNYQVQMMFTAVVVLALGAWVFEVHRRVEAARRVRVSMDLAQMTAALKIYEEANGFYPSTEQGLLALAKKPATEPEPRHWLQLEAQVPRDPWGREYFYRQPGRHNPNGYDLFSSGPDGKPDTEEDNIGNWAPVKK